MTGIERQTLLFRDTFGCFSILHVKCVKRKAQMQYNSILCLLFHSNLTLNVHSCSCKINGHFFAPPRCFFFFNYKTFY